MQYILFHFDMCYFEAVWVIMNSNIPVPESILEKLMRLELVAEDAPLWEEVQETEPDKQGSQEKRPAVDLTKFPVHGLALSIVQSCNLKCIYCYGNEGEYGNEGIMDERTAFRSVDWLIERSGGAKKLSIIFIGGEPLLNLPLLKKVVEYAERRAEEKGKEIRFGMTTNATLLNDDVISYLKKYKIGPLISFDGPAQDANRPFKDGQGSSDIVVKNIKKLLAVMPDITCRATVTEEEHPAKVADIIKEIGVMSCLILPATPSLFGNYANSITRNPDKMLEYHEKDARECLEMIKRRDEKSWYPAALRMIEQLFSKRKRHYFCGAGRGYLGVSATGDIYPCHAFNGTEGMKLSTVFDDNLDRAVYQRGIVNRIEKCKTCWVKYFCGGGCMHVNKAITGELFDPDDVYCQETKHSVKLAIHVYCQLDEADKEFLQKILKKQEGSEELHKDPTLTDKAQV